MDSRGPERYIEGFSDITSPPLSMPSSAKPSAVKDDINQSNLIQTTNNLPINNKECNNKGRKPKSAIKQSNNNIELMNDINDHIRKPSTAIKLTIEEAAGKRSYSQLSKANKQLIHELQSESEAVSNQGASKIVYKAVTKRNNNIRLHN